MIRIYKITNQVNGMSYIGQTCGTIQARWRAHVTTAKRNRGCPALKNAIQKYGEGAFSISVLAICQSGTIAHVMEQAMIRFFVSINPEFGYNISVGGTGARGFKWRPESRAKLSHSALGNTRRKGMTNSPEHREKTRRTLLGHPVSEETKQKIRAARALQPVSRGWKHTDEAKAKMSLAHKGLRHSPATEFKPGLVPWNKK